MRRPFVTTRTIQSIPRPSTQVVYDTPLGDWMRRNKVTPLKLAKAADIDPRVIKRLRDGQMLPGLVVAFKIEQATCGGVPAASWLATPLGKWSWGKRCDWEWATARMSEGQVLAAKSRRRNTLLKLAGVTGGT